MKDAQFTNMSECGETHGGILVVRIHCCCFIHASLILLRQDDGMHVWSFCIATSQTERDLGRSFVRAPTAADALQRIGHPDATVYACMPDIDLPPGHGPFYEEDGCRT